jgi:sugar phosphate isomerase/epimerase
MTAWLDRMDLGVVHPLIYPECRDGGGPIVETLEAIIADETFGAVEIAPIRDPVARRRAGDLLRWSQMQVVYLPILPILFENLGLAGIDSNARTESRKRLHQLIDEAIELDAPLAMVGAPRDPGDAERPALIERLIEDFRELCDYADAQSHNRRLHLTLEPFDRDVEKKRAIGPTREAAALADAIDRENFGLTVDLSHLPLLRETATEALQAAGRHLIHAHIGNCAVDDASLPFFGDFHPRFGHPAGRNDLPEVVGYLQELTKVGYWQRTRERLGGTPILSFELKANPIDQEPPSVLLANGKRTFTRAWAQAGR